jgi:hypothetical protein
VRHRAGFAGFPPRSPITWAAGLVVGVLVGAGLASAVLPRADIGAEAAATPGEERIESWIAARELAGVRLYMPQDEGDPSSLVVHGVRGDATRPVEARFASELIMLQAHRDLLPPESLGGLVTIPGADDSWWQEASDGRRLSVRFGDTLVLLWGLPDDDDLEATARSLVPVGGER